MKWTTPPNFPPRDRVRFAWYPMQGTDGQTYWLCRVRHCEEFQLNWGGGEYVTRILTGASTGD